MTANGLALRSPVMDWQSVLVVSRLSSDDGRNTRPDPPPTHIRVTLDGITEAEQMNIIQSVRKSVTKLDLGRFIR